MNRRSDYYIGRREFVAGVAGVLGALIAILVGLPIIGYLIAPALRTGSTAGWISLVPLSALRPGVPTPCSFSRLKQTGWRRMQVIRTAYAILEDSGDVVVLADLCTHLSCRVHWLPERNVFVCPCHDGIFDRQGNVLSGPPPRPLERFETKIEDGQLFIYVED
ncbi:MAG: Rieske 2Fe-2S domain-containing protein [Anaerolineae bacterium]|nr:Rieske 2Fe-2S domain-containing protein [Anaerolineae bacterium]MDW8072478.1 Rieske 2Fe-2S domain-containing protein [Anaerolineae bacterium]